MRFLADMGVSLATVAALRSLNHDVVHLREQGLIRMADPDIVDKARSEDRIVLTFDLDFGEIMALSRHRSPSIILFRLRNQTPRVVTAKLTQVIHECAPQLTGGAFIAVEDLGYRIRRLPLG